MGNDADMRRLEGDAKQQALIESAKVRGAEAKTPKDWMDIFQEITEHSVKVTMEQAGDGDKVLDRLREWRPAYAHVARELNAHGMPLSEEVELEGPRMGHVNGLPIVEEWPYGVQLKMHWPDGSHLHFKGNAAIVAVTFWIWWVNFQERHLTQMGIAKTAQENSKRILLPGSAESAAYNDAKRKDQGT